jgi:hypothetical protein
MRTTIENTRVAEAMNTKKLTLLFQGQFGISTNIKLNSPIACKLNFINTLKVLDLKFNQMQKLSYKL